MENLATLALTRRIDRMLDPWRARPGPGVTVGVARDGAMLAHRNAGLASIEQAVPIGPETSFRIASVSKQFTCAAILLLVAEGRVDLAAEVPTYLPELPDMGHPVTVAHLMHNSAGIRDMFEVLRLGGSDLGQPTSAAQMHAAILRQRALNFAPGTRYLYSNSNFWLLGRIVEAVSGMALPAFLEARFFGPLGMTMTRMTPSTLEPAPGLATGYAPTDGGFQRMPHAVPIGGEGGLVSSVRDLAIWDMNLTHGTVGGPALHAGLVQQHAFPNGEANGYARGLQIRLHRGVRTESHGGLWPGYKTQFVRAPEHGLVVIAISNDATADPYHLGLDVLDMLLDGRPGVHVVPPMPDRAALEPWVGRWLDRAGGVTLDIELTDAGRLIGRTHGVPFRIVAGGDGWMRASRAAADFTARLGPEGLEVVADAGHRAVYARVAEGAALPAGLDGRYANSEIAAVWTVAGTAVHVAGPIVGAEDWTVMPVEGDVVRLCLPRLLFDSWLDVRVQRGADGAVTGLAVEGGRVRGLLFARQEGA